jgi:hypothetical protein
LEPVFRFAGNRDFSIERQIANDLGIIPGDALLSNVVIWVEGPSELLWVRAWLREYLKLNPSGKGRNLIEGLHYSILMTAGNLIANQSFVESPIEKDQSSASEKSRLVRVNPNPFLIMDHDVQAGEKKARTLRLFNEIREHNLNFPDLSPVSTPFLQIEDIILPNGWILRGRELENYCHPELLKNFYSKISDHGNSTINGIKKVNKSSWDVYSESQLAGTILESRGLKGIKDKSGTLKHKEKLSEYIFENFSSKHLELVPSSILAPNKDMIDDLTQNLKKLVDYITNVCWP